MQQCEALEDFPPGLRNLCALKELDFALCRSSRKVPEGFSGLTGLKKLNMQDCDVDGIVFYEQYFSLCYNHFYKVLKLKNM